MVNAADAQLRQGTGAGSDFRDWLTLPKDYDKAEFARIKAAAKKIRSDSEVFIVIGIGDLIWVLRWPWTFCTIPSLTRYQPKSGKVRKSSLLGIQSAQTICMT